MKNEKVRERMYGLIRKLRQDRIRKVKQANAPAQKEEAQEDLPDAGEVAGLEAMLGQE